MQSPLNNVELPNGLVGLDKIRIDHVIVNALGPIISAPQTDTVKTDIYPLIFGYSEDEHSP